MWCLLESMTGCMNFSPYILCLVQNLSSSHDLYDATNTLIIMLNNIYFFHKTLAIMEFVMSWTCFFFVIIIFLLSKANCFN